MVQYIRTYEKLFWNPRLQHKTVTKIDIEHTINTLTEANTSGSFPYLRLTKVNNKIMNKIFSTT